MAASAPAASGWIVPRLQARVLAMPAVANSPKLQAMMKHEAGPFTIHFWAPIAKWLISIANISDLNKPAEKLSVPQQGALAMTGFIWSRYATQIQPFNWNLLAVNFTMGAVAAYQLSRAVRYQMDKEKVDAAAAVAAPAVAVAAPAAPAAAPPKMQ